MGDSPSSSRRNVRFNLNIPAKGQSPIVDTSAGQSFPFPARFPPVDMEPRDVQFRGSDLPEINVALNSNHYTGSVAPLRIPFHRFDSQSRDLHLTEPLNFPSHRSRQSVVEQQARPRVSDPPPQDNQQVEVPMISPSALLVRSPLGLSEIGSSNDGHYDINIRDSVAPLRPVLSTQFVAIPEVARHSYMAHADVNGFRDTAPHVLLAHQPDRRSLAPDLPPNVYQKPSGTSTAIAPALRSALRRSQSGFDLGKSEVLRRGGTGIMEEGGGTRPGRGVLANLLTLYGISGRQRSRSQSHASHSTWVSGVSPSRCGSTETTGFPTAKDYADRSRCNSMMSEGYDLLDADDPRVTGVPKNTIDQQEHAKETVEEHATLTKRKKRQASIKYHISSVLARQTFVLRLAKALMKFGSPSHRLESQLKATALVLDLNAEFVHMPSIVIASFGDEDTKTSQTHFIKVGGTLQLGRLHSVHTIYRKVVHDEMGVEEATSELNRLIKSKRLFGPVVMTLLSSLCTALICPLAFGGSALDTAISAGEGALLAFLQFGVAEKNAFYSNVFEISVAIIMSFIARALASIPSQIFCYSAISSSGVVLILPGYMILCSALELASKSIVGGSVKLTFAIVYSLFLGFGLTIGSDLYLLVDHHARNRLMAMVNPDTITIRGHFMGTNSTEIPNFAGSFVFTNATAAALAPINIVAGCYRDPSWAWYLQPFPFWTLFIMVPAFSILSSMANGQPLKSRQLPVMVIISCASFAANTAADHYIFGRSDVVSAIGAFVAGTLGNLYSRVTQNGTSFTSMVTGVLFLVPAGIAATGGLSMNYSGDDGDEYSNGLLIGLRTMQVSIGITVGLFASSLLIYSFGRSKRGAIFAF